MTQRALHLNVNFDWIKPSNLFGAVPSILICLTLRVNFTHTDTKLKCTVGRFACVQSRISFSPRSTVTQGPETLDRTADTGETKWSQHKNKTEHNKLVNK